MWRFIWYSLKIKFFPFLKSWLATIDEVGKKLRIEKKGKEKMRLIQKGNRFANKKSKFWLVRMREKSKKLFNYAISWKTCLCLMQNSFLAIVLAMHAN